jgi:hypothetical protein
LARQPEERVVTLAAHHTMLGGSAAMRCAVFASSYARTNIGSWTTANQGSFTMACWVWLNDPPYPTGVGTVMSMHSSTSNVGAQLDAISGNARKFRSVFQNVAVLGPTANEVGGNGEWHHYAISYNYATATFAGFVDGAKLITGTPNRWLNANADLIMSICTNGVATALMNGKVANANMYLRALSASEVAALAAGISVVPSDADHQWLFENDAFADTGTATTKWDLTATGTVTFEDA